MPFDLDPTPTLEVPCQPVSHWSAEEFLAALHPRSATGRASLLMAEGDRMHAKTYRMCELGAVAGTFAEAESYVSMNRFHGPRGRSGLAALNAVWLDLDVHRIPALAHRSRPEIAAYIGACIASAGLPAPAFVNDSGRGFHVIWMLDGAAPAARRRWTALIRAIVAWARPLGADPACVDVSRVLRLPGSWHAEAGRQVTVLAGTAERHAFGAFEATVWHALGRPSRAALAERKALRAARPVRSTELAAHKAPAKPRGLSRRAFWAIALEDLDCLLESLGGIIPAGSRDLWLHLHATALGWTSQPDDLADLIVTKARTAAPGLAEREVRRTMAPTIRRAEQATAGRHTGQADPRYDYSGGRMAELLGVDRTMAAALGLQQIVPVDLRSERNSARRAERRRALGMLPRAIWLAANPTEREQPWRAEGISRATWYRRQREKRALRRRSTVIGMLSGTAQVDPAFGLETGPASLYGGVAQPSASARRPGAPEQEILDKPPASPTEHRSGKPSPQKNAPSSRTVMGEVSEFSAANRSWIKTPDGPVQREGSMIFVDPDVLAKAASRLEPHDLGFLTRISIELARGSVDRHSLAWRLRLNYIEIEQLSDWLRLAEDGRTVLGLNEPSARMTRAAQKPRQGLLFDDPAIGLPCQSSPKPKSAIKSAIIDETIRLMKSAGISESRARSFLGGLFQKHPIGVLADVVHELSRTDEVADPVAWINGALRRRTSQQSQSIAPQVYGRTTTPAPMCVKKDRPLATPEFLGISPKRAERIRQQNSNLQLKINSTDGSN